MPRLLLLAVVSLITTTNSLGASPKPLDKVITITINESGRAIMGRDTMSMDDMSKEVYQRLWKSYMGMGKMPDAIHLGFIGAEDAGDRDAAIKAIKKGQQKALTDLCLEKHKTTFEHLTANKQDKLKRQFPVLFQENFT